MKFSIRAALACFILDVVPGPDSGHGVRAAQVVEPQGGETDLGGQPLEIAVDVPVGQATSQLASKYQDISLKLDPKN